VNGYIIFKINRYKLWIVAVLVAIILSGAEVTFDGRRDIFFADQHNHVIHSASMVKAIKDLNFPPRVSHVLSGGLGNPYHQFYSPLCHTYVALISLFSFDLISGFSYSTILLLALAFVYSFKLGQYLTLSNHCATVTAFLFVSAPYIAADRVLRGAFPEYTAFCLLPMVLYFNLRALFLKRFKIWLLAVLSTSVLIQSHLITGSFFIFFYAFFHILALSQSFLTYIFYSKLLKRNTHVEMFKNNMFKILNKNLIAAMICTVAVLLSMWHLGPVAFYDDILMKFMLTGQHIAGSGHHTPILSVFSVTDTAFTFLVAEEQPGRYQAGMFLIVAFASFLMIFSGKGKSWSVPFAITTGIIISIVVRPVLFNYPPLKYVDIAQLSYRFLSFFTLLASIAGAVALANFFKRNVFISHASKSAFVLAIISFSLVTGSRYIYPSVTKLPWVNYMVNTQMINSRSKLVYGEDAYLRVPPQDDVGLEAWTDSERDTVDWTGVPGDWRFFVDLQEYSKISGGPPGEVLLNVLYYPGLQQIDVAIDGKPVLADLDTYWQKRVDFGPFDENFPVPGSFHGLKLSGLQNAGILEARVRFIGFRWANWTSFITLTIIVAVPFVRLLRKRLSSCKD
jgi:hypothetical protein